MGFTVSGLSMSFFLPGVLTDFGWTSTAAQIYTVPVYMFALALTLLMAWSSDKLKHRYTFLILCLAMSTIGYGLALGQEHLSRGVKYLGCFLIAGGGLCASPLCIVFLANNEAGHWKRGVSSAAQVSCGGIAGVIGASVFLQREKPLYTTGYGVGLGMVWVAGLSATAMAVLMSWENRQRNSGRRDVRLSWPSEKLEGMGDYHPRFRYML